MTSARRIGSNFVIAFCLMVPLYDMVTQEEHFPFAPYTMYSARYALDRLNDGGFAVYGIKGASEFPLRAIGVLAEARLETEYGAIHRGKGRPAVEDAMMRTLESCARDPGCVAIDQDGRSQGKPEGIRFAKVEYDSVEALRRAQPSRSITMAEARLPAKGARQ